MSGCAGPSRQRGGFTLVELLVVITIIGVLLSLLSVGIYSAYESSKHHALVNDITQVSFGLEQFHERYGCYPTDMHRDLEIKAFIKKAFPRADHGAFGAFIQKPIGNQPLDDIDPPEALVLFLRYLNPNHRNPFQFAATMAADRNAWKNPPDNVQIFFDFPAGTLQDMDEDGFPEFTQKYAHGAPLVYFDAQSYENEFGADAPCYPDAALANRNFTSVTWLSSYDVDPGTLHDPRLCVHFRRLVGPGRSYDPNGYQLICAGKDGRFGAADNHATILFNDQGQYAGTLMLSEKDNITNFSKGKTMSDFIGE